MTAACACVTTACGHVPALPAGLGGPVAEVDVLAVEAEALVEPAELVEHLAAQKQERGEHPVGLDRLGRALVEQVVVDLARLRAQGLPERRSPDDRAADGRESAARRLPACRRGTQLRADDPGARWVSANSRRRPTASGRACGVRVRDDDERRARGGDPAVRVGREAERPLVHDQPCVDGRAPAGSRRRRARPPEARARRGSGRASGSGPCVTTTPATLTGAPGTPRASGGRSPPS